MNRRLIFVSLILIFGIFALNAKKGQRPANNDKSHTANAYSAAYVADGNEWQDPTRLSYGKLPAKPAAWLFPTEAEAQQVLPFHDSWVKNLNGKWAFAWVNHPNLRPSDFQNPEYDASTWDSIHVPSNWNIAGLGDYGSMKYGRPIYVNQKVIFQHSVNPDDWRGGVMRTPHANWTTYKDRNEVGCYRRSFTVPASWNGNDIFLRFDGVDSFFYLYVNGVCVGFSKDSRTAATFCITPFVHIGENIIAVEVYRSSDGSFLEAQDMFRLPGIFRSVWLYTEPKQRIEKVQVNTEFNPTYTSAKLNINTWLLTPNPGSRLTIATRLYPLNLYSDSVTQPDIDQTFFAVPVNKDSCLRCFQITVPVKNPKLWSAEEPNRYLLTISLLGDNGQELQSTALYIGFREAEIADCKAEDTEYNCAGRYFLLNGKPVKLRGVNRHESDPTTGHALTHQRMEADIAAMKRANINHVRNSHYPTDPYWYYLCDKYGIYLMDEANLESHEYYYGKASLSHVPEFQDAHVNRVMNMARANVNYPSIIIWSLGNEAGPGINFKAAYDSLKALDPRPINYERNNDYADLGSCQYPAVSWVDELVKGNMDGIKYPFHINEFAHSMGNSLGNFKDYWEAIETTAHVMGGAIWDWVDQGLYHTDSISNVRYIAYGGDFGDYPNDGQFVMNGVMLADLTPKPQYYEVKKVYQPFEVRADSGMTHLEIFNRNYFATPANYICTATLLRNGEEIEKVEITGLDTLPPRNRIQVPFPFDIPTLDSQSEYFVNIAFTLRQPTPWAEKGYVVSVDQIAIPSRLCTNLTTIGSKTSKNKISVDKKNLSVCGKNFQVRFNPTDGTIDQWIFEGDTIFNTGHGPRLDAFRAYVNNDTWLYESLFSTGLHNLHHVVSDQPSVHKTSKGEIAVTFNIHSQAPYTSKIHGGTSSGHPRIENFKDSVCTFAFDTQLCYIISNDGIDVNAEIVSTDSTIDLGRIGYSMELPKTFSAIEYYGRGPWENYPDRKSGSPIGRYKSSVNDQFVDYVKPQNMANHEDTRWLTLLTPTNLMLTVTASEPFSFTALPYSEMDLLMAPHPYQLPESHYTHLHVDKAVTGLGGYSCGQGPPFDCDRVKARPTTISFSIRPHRK